MFSPPTSFWNKKWTWKRKALCTIWNPAFHCMTGRRQGIWKAPQGSDCDLVHLYGTISPDSRESLHLAQILGRLGGGGGGGTVALSQETWTVAQMPPLTSCLILNKLLCLSRLIFFICQVKWRLWNRWSLKILPALQFYSGSVCTCRQGCGGGKGTGEGSKFSQGNKTLLPGAALCPHCCVVQACLRLSK